MPVRISKNRVALENIPLNEAKGADIASASTVNLDSATGNLVDITGTTAVTAITLSRGYERTVRFTGSLVLTHGASLVLPSAGNITTSAGDFAIFRGYDSGVVRCVSYTKSSGEPIVGSGNTYNLTNIIYPRADGDWRGIYRGGWRPSFFNQQWGGAQWGNGPDGSLVDFATGFIDDATANSFAHTAPITYISQGLKTSEAISLSAAWVKIFKVGNPTNNLELYIYPDSGSGIKPTGSTPITNGTATAQSGKLHSANTNGDWVRFVFPTPPSLSANTFYHIVMKSSGAVDASNYWRWKANASKKYPHGNYAQADATPTWAESSANANIFLLENPSPTKFLQPSGQFDGKLQFAEGNPLDQSKSLSQPLKNFFDGREFTYRIVTNGLTKDKTVADFVYGLDHDRVVLRCNATTGYMQVDVYEQDGTKHTVTGTTDCSSGTKDIAIYVRAKGDGSDSVKLYVNGTSEGTPVSSATITFSPEFRDLGTAWLGGGFPIAPTWTKNTAMGSLPSADGWTFGGTATESSAFSVSGGKLYQNYNGFGSTQTGWYERTTTLSNTNGWAISLKIKRTAGDNTSGYAVFALRIHDGTKQCNIYFYDYFIYVASGGETANAQVNLTDREHVFLVVGKGSDFFVFVDGKLIADMTGKMTTAATEGNIVKFGDLDTTAGKNADVVIDYIKDYNTAWLPPQFTSGSLSESAFFSGDRTSILSSLYNGGTFKSVREYCGMEREYVEHIEYKYLLRGITSGPTTTSTTPVLLTDMEAFVVAEQVRLNTAFAASNGTASANLSVSTYLDGADIAEPLSETADVASAFRVLALWSSKLTFAGLHKLETRWKVGTGTGTVTGTQRTINIEAE